MKDTLILEPSQAGHLGQGRKELKDEQLFARLIGAAVLLALAVIVLPFVLDGSGSQREYEYAETLPVEPARPVLEKSFSSRQPDPANTEVQDFQAPPTRDEIVANVPEKTPLTDLQRTSATLQTTEQLASTVATAADGGVANAALANAGQANGVQGNSLNTMPLQPGWNIQVASFVRDANAIKLIKRLQAQNIPAYANRVQGSTRTLIRVLAGPFVNQIDALALQNGIDADYRVESLMVRGR